MVRNNNPAVVKTNGENLLLVSLNSGEAIFVKSKGVYVGSIYVYKLCAAYRRSGNAFDSRGTIYFLICKEA